MSGFDTVFGKCPIHGGGGENDPSPGSAFSTEDHTGEGYQLVKYQGKWMCNRCKNKLIAHQQDKINLAGHRREQRFRDKVGVKRHME